MSADADVVVAGGGPAGLQFAREIASRSEYSVTVLEANDRLSDNDKSTGGTFDQVIERYGIPDSVVMAENEDVVFEAPGASSRLPIPGYVLDFPAFLEFLGEDAESHGAEIRTGARVAEPVVERGRVVGVEYWDDGEKRRFDADLVVDATGPRAVLAKQLDMFDPASAQRGIGKEYEVRGRYDLDSMLFRFDHEVAPGGYAWTFPAGDDVFKVGICWIEDFYDTHRAPDDGTIDEYVAEWLTRDPRWEAEDRRAVHAGDAVSNNSINQRATDGLVAVGDAVSSINPLFGEGIRPGMESAEMAANVALAALDRGDTSRERLSVYEDAWNDEKGLQWRIQRIVCELLYDFTPEQQRRFVTSAGRLSDAQVGRLQAYELTVGDYLDLYPFDPSDLSKLPAIARHV
ncbi:NAD(P)/FAD-dependent oxidoreductase [Halosimplex salinum]|uniref:NAD(P)/FAD-dependent oxidoreductase n=1 Tax=Halosimplex salinum TaxID=1710538 RepID=UPI000F4A12D4|nr:NAD(P)/FAD-dependent oxidoreductase [Halosimplex salinum]